MKVARFTKIRPLVQEYQHVHFWRALNISTGAVLRLVLDLQQLV